MVKKSNLVLIVSAILAAGVLIAGCTQDSGSLQPGESPSSGIYTPSPSSGSTETGNNDRPPFNLSDAQNRTPPSGMMNGTPPGMNGTLTFGSSLWNEWHTSFRPATFWCDEPDTLPPALLRQHSDTVVEKRYSTQG